MWLTSRCCLEHHLPPLSRRNCQKDRFLPHHHLHHLSSAPLTWEKPRLIPLPSVEDIPTHWRPRFPSLSHTHTLFLVCLVGLPGERLLSSHAACTRKHPLLQPRGYYCSSFISLLSHHLFARTPQPVCKRWTYLLWHHTPLSPVCNRAVVTNNLNTRVSADAHWIIVCLRVCCLFVAISCFWFLFCCFWAS